ncbi:hypothetical protein [Blastopirellula marina]|uniref:YtkA-like domain-containing protein n=1 Tax=Blastopirellula marina TaxID=124 RepID=A0A2S8GI35_9BACT|nr:hypothetical protein [Blastopirellula marina]PQO44106.1 hypothetical protein C5Y93_21460 [Blastopirellula marina]
MSPVFRTLVALTALLGMTQLVAADGGKLQLRREVGPYQVTIFTSPTPLRPGPVDLSVLVQDQSGKIVNDADIEFQLKSESGALLLQPATQAAATNKLLQSAKFVLPEGGVWQVETRIAGDATVHVDFEFAAYETHSDSITAGWMLLLPLAAITLFIARERLLQRRPRGK